MAQPDYEDDDDDDDDRPRRDYDDPGVVGAVIPYNNPASLIAYYCGIFSFIPCVGMFLGPVAFVCGLVKLKATRVNLWVRGTGQFIAGNVLGTITTLAHLAVVVFIIVGPRWN